MVDLDFDYYKRDDVIHHLEDYYKPDHVAHIGTYTIMGVKSGLKDVGRVLEVPFETMNNISKELDEILDKPQPKFKDYDELKDSPNDNDKEAWKRFHKLEEDNSQIFRLARKFEGLRRNFGVHASGILAMPIPITDMVPLRVADGVRVCLYTGPELEDINLVKLDILGLRNLSVVDDCLKHLEKPISYEEFMNKVDLNDPKVYSMIRERKTDAVFQMESDLFKGIIGEIQPTDINDLVAITSMARPGPVKVGMSHQYARRKNGQEETTPLLRGMENILDSTYGLIYTQEACMRISVQAFGFNNNQSDSIVRKIIGKKKIDKLEMLRRMIIYGKLNTEGPEGWHDNPNLPWYDLKKEYGDEISGGLKKEYSLEELETFWNILMGFAEYCFNASHALSYSIISVWTAWLKYYYPVEFYASVLSNQETEEKIAKYIKVAESEGIKVIVPDINISEDKFTPNAKDKTIYYGLGSIKGIGEAAVKEIISKRPYESLEDLFNKLPKKILNKRVITALVKAGALDSFDSDQNRYFLMNQCMNLRKEKDYTDFNIKDYNRNICMEWEKEVLSAPITYKPWWDTIEVNSRVNIDQALILSYREQKDKKGGLMAFANLLINNCNIEAVIFASVYKKCLGSFDPQINYSRYISLTGKKDERNKLIINSASTYNVVEKIKDLGDIFK